MSRHRLDSSRRYLAIAFAIVAGAAICGEAGAQPGPADQPAAASLSLSQAIARFRSSSFDLLLSDAAVKSAAAEEVIAGAVANPNLTASAGKSFAYDPRTCAGCSSVAWSAGLSDEGSLVNVLSGKRALRQQIARAALEAARFNREDARRTLEFAVKQQFIAAAAAQESLALAVEAARLAHETLELVNIRYRAGAVSEADVARAETAKLEGEQSVDAAQQAVISEKQALAFLLGDHPPLMEFAVDGGALHERAPEVLESLTKDELFRLALRRRPDLRAAALERDGAVASVALNKRQRLPDIGLFAQYSQEGTGQNAIQPPTVTVGISTPLPLFYQYRGEIDRASASLASQRIQLSKTEAAIAAEVGGALASYTSAKSRINRMESRLRERAKRARDLVLVQYNKGAASLLELLDAQRTVTTISTEYVQVLAAYRTAVFALEQATGTDLQR